MCSYLLVCQVLSQTQCTLVKHCICVPTLELDPDIFGRVSGVAGAHTDRAKSSGQHYLTFITCTCLLGYINDNGKLHLRRFETFLKALSQVREVLSMI